jgi:hypothetical protein
MVSSDFSLSVCSEPRPCCLRWIMAGESQQARLTWGAQIMPLDRFSQRARIDRVLTFALIHLSGERGQRPVLARAKVAPPSTGITVPVT